MRDILVFSESFKHWAPSVEYAAHLAAVLDGHLTGVWACPSPRSAIPSFESPELLTELVQATLDLEAEAFSNGEAFIEHVRPWCGPRGSWQVAEGYVPDVLQLLGRWHDLLVLSRTDRSAWGSLSAVGSIVLRSEMPCLVLPWGTEPSPNFDSVAIAWNGSAEAIRAVHDALPLLAKAKAVTVLHGEQQPPISMLSWNPPFDMVTYLERHGIACTSQLLDPGADDVAIGSRLLDAASNAHAKLLIMGAYGHTRFNEWVLGGATRYVLGHATLPLLLRH